MACVNPRWTFRFPEVEGTNGPFEISPREMTLRIERGSYDYCRAEFDVSVGREMKFHTENPRGELRYATTVEVCLDGEPMHVLYFKPDFVTYGDHGTYIELHDMQESLDSGLVDKYWESVSLREAYEYVFEKRTTELIRDIKFTIPDELPTGEPFKNVLIGQDRLQPDMFEWGKDASEDQYYEPKATEKVMDSYYAVDFHQVSPAKAMWELNKKFQVRTWVDTNYTLWVGLPESVASHHIAAPDDRRVWRYNYDGVNISHPRDPIYAVIVEGRWVDEPGVGGLDDIVSWFNHNDDDGFGDVRAEGVAFVPGVDPEKGETFKVKDTDAKRDALAHVAQTALYEKMKQHHAGSVEINTELSGEEVSPLRSLTVGDALHLVPDDRWFPNATASSGQLGEKPEPWELDCDGQFVHNEIYLVNGVIHNVSGEEWTMTANVVIYPDMPVKKFVRYFDPRSGDYVTEEDVFSDVDGIVPRFFSDPLEDF